MYQSEKIGNCRNYRPLASDMVSMYNKGLFHVNCRNCENFSNNNCLDVEVQSVDYFC